jgi:hypothetical protein
MDTSQMSSRRATDLSRTSSEINRILNDIDIVEKLFYVVAARGGQPIAVIPSDREQLRESTARPSARE